ncbi:MAG TPA: hypothetical protein VHR45_14030 [Thermoanaerobaculia bacterium]|nr:hypothetical protein [Thermoanaerobaculia bacterium]
MSREGALGVSLLLLLSAVDPVLAAQTSAPVPATGAPSSHTNSTNTGGPSHTGTGTNPNDPGGPSRTTGGTTTTTTKAAGKHPSKKNHSFTGTVGEVNDTEKGFSLTGPPPSGTTVVAINTNDKTTYAKGQSWSDVKDGGTATVSYETVDGKNWAVRITVKHTKAAKKPKTTG